MHVLPLQRCTVIDAALVAPLIHVRLILARMFELAARFVGAAGTGVIDATLMDAEAVLEAPPLSVTVSDAVYVPGFEYRCVVTGPVPKAPSPNDHAHEVTVPLGLTDPEPSNVTRRGATPVDGVADMTAVVVPETWKQVMNAS